MYSISFKERMNISDVYRIVVEHIMNTPDRIALNRKGEKLYECFNVSLTFMSDQDCYFNVRNPSLTYFEKELKWYASGSLALEDALECSKYWNNCTDNGRTVNSNYGYLIFHRKNDKGFTQFQHAYNMLSRNLDTKKAVMVIYGPDHAYMSNDNPCTMFIEFHTLYRGEQHERRELDMTVYMRSSDVWFGLPYDVPFFRAVQHTMCGLLRKKYPALQIGRYVHSAANMHLYCRNAEAFTENVKQYDLTSMERIQDYAKRMYQFRTILYNGVKMFETITHGEEEPMEKNNDMKFMAAAWKESEKSTCLKKHCGCVITNDSGVIIATGFGAKYGKGCTECMRDKGEVFYGDGCWSVHAETRAIMDFMNYVGRIYSDEYALATDMTEVIRDVAATCTVYVTHGPCDACLKFLDFYGFKRVKYDIPYKTDYEGHWPNIRVTRVKYTADGDKLGKYAPGKGPKCC